MRFSLDGLEVFFPYDYVYREQFQYMLELKRTLDAKGDAILEMPTGTGKTVSLLALITSYQFAHPECGKLIYCTRTVPEMTKCVEELKRVIQYREAELAASASAAASIRPPSNMLAVCLSSRRNMCIHPDVVGEGEREKVDAACRSMTASWVRQKAQDGDASVKLCDFFEQYEKLGSDADLRGIYDLDDLKQLGRDRGWCPYFLARHVISFANVIVYNYQYMLDPKIAAMVSKELDDKSIVVFDEAHNIDNVCIEALSVTLDRKAVEGAGRGLTQLGSEVKRLRQADAQRLQDEYARLVHGMGGGGEGEAGAGAAGAGAAAAAVALNGGEEQPGSPVLPADVLAEAVPGSIRNADLFVRFMKHVVRYLRDKIKVAAVLAEAPPRFLHDMATALAIDVKPLKFAYSRLGSLLRTLQVADTEDFAALQLVADFVTLLATYPTGFMVISEPSAPRTPHIPDPIMQLCCLDPSLAIKPVFARFQSVILTSGTLSPLDMYPKMLNFNPVVRASLEMSIVRPCICPMVVSRGGDQTPMSTKFELRGDRAVVRNYGALLVQMCAAVPDGVVAFFPSYGYMEGTVAAWAESGVLAQVQAHKLLFIETKDIVETTLSLNNYKRACDAGRGAVFLSVARGKVAEGIDFDRHYGRAVLLFGIPFQYTLSHVLRARLAYLRDTFGVREADFLTFDALRQAAQCVGRVIRSKRDYGVIVFADKRYASADKRSKLPQWVLQFMPDARVGLSTPVAVGLAQRFLKEMAQPLPPGVDRAARTLLAKEDLDAMAAAAADVAPANVGSGGSGAGGVEVARAGLLLLPAAVASGLSLPSGLAGFGAATGSSAAGSGSGGGVAAGLRGVAFGLVPAAVGPSAAATTAAVDAMSASLADAAELSPAELLALQQVEEEFAMGGSAAAASAAVAAASSVAPPSASSASSHEGAALEAGAAADGGIAGFATHVSSAVAAGFLVNITGTGRDAAGTGVTVAGCTTAELLPATGGDDAAGTGIGTKRRARPA